MMAPQSAEEIVAESFSETLGGKAFGESKIRSTWLLSFAGKSYNIEFTNSKASGMKRIFVNSHLQHESKVLLSPTFKYTWRLDGHVFSIVPKEVIANVDCSFDLCIDGRPFQVYERRKLLTISQKQERTPIATHSVGQRNRRSSSEHSHRMLSTDKPRSCLKREGSDRKRSVSFKMRTGERDHSRVCSSRGNKENDSPNARECVEEDSASSAHSCLKAAKESHSIAAAAQGERPVSAPVLRDGPLMMEVVPVSKPTNPFMVVEPQPATCTKQTNPFVICSPKVVPTVGKALSTADAEHGSDGSKPYPASQALVGSESAAYSQRSSVRDPWSHFVPTLGNAATLKHETQREEMWPSKENVNNGPVVEQSRRNSPWDPWAPTIAAAPCTALLAAGAKPEATREERLAPLAAMVDTFPAASPRQADPWNAWPATMPSEDRSGWGVEWDGGWPVADANSGSA